MHRVDAVTHQQAGAHGTKFNVGDKVRLSPGFKDEGASASASASASTARTHVCASSKRAVTYQTHMNLGILTKFSACHLTTLNPAQELQCTVHSDRKKTWER